MVGSSADLLLLFPHAVLESVEREYGHILRGVNHKLSSSSLGPFLSPH